MTDDTMKLCSNCADFKTPETNKPCSICLPVAISSKEHNRPNWTPKAPTLWEELDATVQQLVKIVEKAKGQRNGL
ncbi:MAG: hypothetical protein GY807_05395 [Gammaproteobacteria bacterium]|nr:hypothetical protein [Gammaproteobacteria bacterium]